MRLADLRVRCTNVWCNTRAPNSTPKSWLDERDGGKDARDQIDAKVGYEDAEDRRCARVYQDIEAVQRSSVSWRKKGRQRANETEARTGL